ATNGGTGSGSTGGGAASAGSSSPDACAVDTELAALSPLNIVFVYDKSGSMGNPNDGFDPAARWDPMQTGMLAFFSDPSSSSINAALSFFPVNGDLTTACGGPYDNPQAATPRGLGLTPLNTDQGRNAFVTLLGATAPQGGTPTLPALNGGIKLAQKIAGEHPGAKTVVVLVTDGEPGFFVDGQVVAGCTDNDVAHVAAVAADALAGTPSIQTYVVGIGPSLDALQAIAQAGGTEQATIMSDADPKNTSKLFHDTLAAIRTETFSCDFPLPKAPPGQTLDSVNVAFESSAGTEATIPRNDACSPGGGWHYDVPNAPTKVVLCEDSCAEIQGDTKGQLSVVFGCATVVR
ncbi:MAG TPA: vWA domain-containing protein, partial [Polyangiaceae bacterium]|nr:vWA domain-containing protein [Polyangiaceae bacterium]